MAHQPLPVLLQVAGSALAQRQRVVQLAVMPASRLRALFGKWAPVLAERARGIDPTPVAYEREPANSVSREGTYAREIDDLSVLRAPLRGYAESVGAELLERVLAARRPGGG